MSKIGLLVVDFQEGLVGENPFNKKNTINNIKLLIKECRDKNIEVIYVSHDGGKDDELEVGFDGWQIYNSIHRKKAK